MKKLIKEIYKLLPIKNSLSVKRSQIINSNRENLPKFPPTKAKAFSLNDLKPIPQGWRIKEPDFVGIGTVKAGTTWWFSILLNHPQIVPNLLNIKELRHKGYKELRYFPHFTHQDLTEAQILTYHQAFATPKGSICGEWSPIYFSHPLCIKQLYQAAPNTKILLMLRNPIDRMMSALNQVAHSSKRFGFNKQQYQLFNIFSNYPKELNYSCYFYQLKQLLKYFDRSQILVLQYEKCKINPQQEISRTYRFLGIDDQYQPVSIKQSVNKLNYLISPFKHKERKRLAEYFSDDVRATVELFPEIDISLWSDFAPSEKKEVLI